MSRSILIRFIFAALTSALLFAGAGQAKAATIYSQPFTPSFIFTSQTDPTYGNFATSYDNFTLASSDTIRNVEWTGSYINPPTQGAITGFTITFYANNGGAPGAAIQTENISGNANETLLGTFGTSQTAAYTYNANLPTALTATGGTQYWMSIVADSAYPPEWGWDSGSGGDGVMYQSISGVSGGTPEMNPSYAPSGTVFDLAFTLSDTPAVPEPATISMLGIGIAALAGYRLRCLRSPFANAP
jgi:hypothetical protein